MRLILKERFLRSPFPISFLCPLVPLHLRLPLDLFELVLEEQWLPLNSLLRLLDLLLLLLRHLELLLLLDVLVLLDLNLFDDFVAEGAETADAADEAGDRLLLLVAGAASSVGGIV